MCGRFTLVVEGEVIEVQFRVKTEGLDLRPRYNIAPGQEVPIITSEPWGRRISLARWGLVPRWAKDPGIGSRLINARGETLAAKPAFRDSFYRRRCLIPADGFYEWRKEGRNRLPYRIYLPERTVFAFAGLWDIWTSSMGNQLSSFSIITVEPNGFMRDIHHRMPAILASSAEQDQWLAGSQPDDWQQLLTPYSGVMAAYRVSRLVNSPAADSPACLARLEE